MEEVAEAVEKVITEWNATVEKTQEHIKEIERCGTSGKGTLEANSLPRLNAAAQDGLAILRSLQFRLDLLGQQLSSEEEVESAQEKLKVWKEQYESLHMNLRSANLKAKANMKKAAQEERELLLGGGEESTIRRRNLQTNAGMTSAAESITESLRRTRQLMVQEVERSTNTLVASEESTSVLRKAEGEYKGHRSLLMRTRQLLNTMQRQDVLDRVILVIGFICFISAVLYVVSKRVGLLKLQRKLAAAIKSGSVGVQDIVGGVATLLAEDDLHQDILVPQADPLVNMHDEL
ncbi:hypothetical protein H6P81_020939 [Aristolochia fimbriata]|uniref:Sec20 C-terminal domain-containing protein n=1 Tax=Aristolochia fimbriata TaxID=158543 RepID=A0AAV7DWX4_ARIFI|nr:hypothetical protein H6P81_020939 [Aristolochia fimbriata]